MTTQGSGTATQVGGASATGITRNDRIRQVTITAAEIFCLVGTLVGIGVLGTAVEETSGGALSADATLLAPATPAFSIWSVVYVGLFGYTIWQWFYPTSPRARAIGWWAAASMVLNACWLLVTQQGWIWVSVAVIAALVVVLGRLMVALGTNPDAPWWEKALLDGTFGLYLGWVAVATCANITAALVSSGVDPAPPASEWIAVAVLLVAAAIGVGLAYRLGGRWAIAAAMAWGLGWIAVGRLTDAPESALVAVGAIAAAVIVVVAVPIARNRLRATAPA